MLFCLEQTEFCNCNTVNELCNFMNLRTHLTKRDMFEYAKAIVHVTMNKLNCVHYDSISIQEVE